MKRVDLAMIPVEQSLIPLMKRNIKDLGGGYSLTEYIGYVVAMHQRVLAMNNQSKENPSEPDNQGN